MKYGLQYVTVSWLCPCSLRFISYLASFSKTVECWYSSTAVLLHAKRLHLLSVYITCFVQAYRIWSLCFICHKCRCITWLIHDFSARYNRYSAGITVPACGLCTCVILFYLYILLNNVALLDCDINSSVMNQSCLHINLFNCYFNTNKYGVTEIFSTLST